MCLVGHVMIVDVALGITNTSIMLYLGMDSRLMLWPWLTELGSNIVVTSGSFLDIS